MKPVHGTVVMGRGGFSLPNRATEVAPTLAEKVECSFIYTKLDNKAFRRTDAVYPAAELFIL